LQIERISRAGYSSRGEGLREQDDWDDADHMIQ
jgi:hypothetical protein